MTDFITEPARDIPVIRRTDVLVVGSGPGGLAAGWCQTNANSSQFRLLAVASGCKEAAPLNESSGAGGLVVFPV